MFYYTTILYLLYYNIHNYMITARDKAKIKGCEKIPLPPSPSSPRTKKKKAVSASSYAL